MVRKVAVLLFVTGLMLAICQPCEAGRRHHGGHHGHHDGGWVAPLVAGTAGLIIGGALAVATSPPVYYPPPSSVQQVIFVQVPVRTAQVKCCQCGAHWKWQGIGEPAYGVLPCGCWGQFQYWWI